MCRSVCYTLIIFAIFVAVSGYEAIDYRKYLSPEELNQLQNGGTYEFDHYNKTLTELVDKPTCTKPGPMCGSCATVFECIQIGGSFIMEQLDDCPAGSSCLESIGSCTTGNNPSCDQTPTDYIFTCRQVGIFPNAFNCQRFHICVPKNPSSTEVNPVSIPQSCNEEFYYDPKTTLCRYKLTEDTNCPVVVPSCSSSGEAGLVPHNPALYYICLRSEVGVTYSPQMFACSGNYVYDLNSKTCVDPTPDSGIDAGNKCIGKGDFYDPASVFSYFQCFDTGVSPIRRVCDSQTRFDHVSGKCVDITWADFEW